MALNNQTVQGKIYAPELGEETLADLLEQLKPSGVVSVRRMYLDPSKQHIPLFVLTFFSSVCPKYIRVGYSQYAVDVFIPSPFRCGKCCRYGHSAINCRSGTKCSKCGAGDHLRQSCPSEIVRCVNCKGEHSSLDKNCPTYKLEQKICETRVNHKVSYALAKKYVLEQAMTGGPRGISHQTDNQALSGVDVTSKRMFPDLPKAQLSQDNQRKQAHQRSGVQKQNITSQPISQESLNTWITPGQHGGQWKAGRMDGVTVGKETNLYSRGQSQDLGTLRHDWTHLTHEDELSLPQLSQISSSPLSSQIDQANVENNDNLSSLSVLKMIMTKMLPTLMNLVLCNNLSNKVACFIEIGSLFGIQDLVTSSLEELGYSSLSNSQ